jgi:hypothetical protein
MTFCGDKQGGIAAILPTFQYCHSERSEETHFVRSLVVGHQQYWVLKSIIFSASQIALDFNLFFE